jgi:hypothetical protein
MHTIQLAYSIDGTNWATAMTFKCIAFLYDMVPEVETEGAQARRMGTTADKCQKITPRMQGKMEFAWSNFNTRINQTPDGNTKMKFLQYWLCAPNRRIYFQYGSKHIPGGWTDFDSSSNTNYVIVTNNSYDYRRFNSNTSDATGDKVLGVTIEFERRAAPSLAKWDGTSFT